MDNPLPKPKRPAKSGRIVDAAIFLPALGAVLVFVPMLWPNQAENAAIKTSDALIYLFGVWAVMIVLAVLLSRLLMHGRKTDD